MRIDGIILRELHMPLVRPFETSFGVTRNRRILLAEFESEGLTGWGECTAGERPHFSGESTDTAWQVIVNELGPMLASATRRAWRRLSQDLQLSARQPHGEGRARKRNLGPRSPTRRRLAFAADRRRARHDSVRRFTRDSEIHPRIAWTSSRGNWPPATSASS